MQKIIYYLRDLSTGEYVTNDWRNPRSKNVSAAREFDNEDRLGLFLHAEIRAEEEGHSHYITEGDHFEVIETRKIVWK